MNCDQFQESYALYVLGMLEGTERQALESHLKEGCPTCSKAVSEMSQIVAMLPYSVPQKDPSPRAKGTVFERVRASQRAVDTQIAHGPPFRWAWLWAAATALILVSAVGLGWYTLQLRARWSEENSQNAKLRQRIESYQQLESETLKLKQQLSDLARKFSTETSSVDPGRQISALMQALDTAKRNNAEAAQALSAERSKVKQLQTNLENQKKVLLAAEAELKNKERLYREQLTEKEASLRASESKVAAFLNDIALLSRQVNQFKATIDEQQKKLSHQMEIINLVQSPGLKFVSLKGTQKGSTLSGHAFLVGTDKLLFYGFNLPTLPNQKTYQLWLIRSKTPTVVSGGTFNPDAQGNAILEFNQTRLVSDVTALAITDEPAGGSPQPTGTKLLLGPS